MWRKYLRDFKVEEFQKGKRFVGIIQYSHQFKRISRSLTRCENKANLRLKLNLKFYFFVKSENKSSQSQNDHMYFRRFCHFLQQMIKAIYRKCMRMKNKMLGTCQAPKYNWRRPISAVDFAYASANQRCEFVDE